MKGESLLSNICSVSPGGKTFVGIRSRQEDIEVLFPLGYRLKKDEQELREDVRLLLRVLSVFSKKQGEYFRILEPNYLKCDIPVDAYRVVIEHYLSFGHYYTESEPSYKTETRGKTDWNKTIKRNKPEIIDGSPIYLERTVRVSRPNENNLITLIHRWCVYLAFYHLGWFYSVPVPQKPEFAVTEANKGMCLSLLYAKASRTFKDDDRRLFQAMIAIIESKDGEKQNQERHFGVEGFEYVWEWMIDDVFGIGKAEKKRYLPNVRWTERGSGGSGTPVPLRPDSVMELEQEYYVLDAKYYRYGQTKDMNDLPGTADIAKQIVYGEVVRKETGKKTYNAFLLPFAQRDPSGENWVINAAEATGDWIKDPEPHERIQGILMDTKTLMEAYCGRRESRKRELATAIKGRSE